MLNIIRSKANPRIVGLILSDSLREDQPAVKVTQTSLDQAPPGCIFNYNSKCWDITSPDDFQAQFLALEFLATHVPVKVKVVIIDLPNSIH